MDCKLKEQIQKYVTAHIDEAEELLIELGKIPAPSHMEDRRAEFCREWFVSLGATDVSIDSAKNVVCKLGFDAFDDVTVFMAHTDIVFPDEETLPMRLEGRKIHAPGIGDDTANLVCLLMAAKYILTERPELKTALLLVANSCEEGLGNLDGSKEIIKSYGSRIRAFYSFDGYLSQCTSIAVGSYRYRITIKTAGGHSWLDFGATNAIEVAAKLIGRLYEIQVPTEAPTTYNVGVIQGGSTVNSIAQQASLLYEFRSTSQKCLKIMEQHLNRILEDMSGSFEITTELLGVRPGNGELDEAALNDFTAATVARIQEVYDGEMDFGAYSTDSNIPLSVGILANTVGLIKGGNPHTREEWMELDSLKNGITLALRLMLDYTCM